MRFLHFRVNVIPADPAAKVCPVSIDGFFPWSMVLAGRNQVAMQRLSCPLDDCMGPEVPQARIFFPSSWIPIEGGYWAYTSTWTLDCSPQNLAEIPTCLVNAACRGKVT